MKRILTDAEHAKQHELSMRGAIYADSSMHDTASAERILKL